MPNTNVPKEERNRRYGVLRQIGCPRPVAKRMMDYSYNNYINVLVRLTKQNGNDSIKNT